MITFQILSLLYVYFQDGVSPTLQAKKPGVVIGPIWKKPGLSSSDIRRIHKLYKCQGNMTSRTKSHTFFFLSFLFPFLSLFLISSINLPLFSYMLLLSLPLFSSRTFPLSINIISGPCYFVLHVQSPD
jgi:hypothetical protein